MTPPPAPARAHYFRGVHMEEKPVGRLGSFHAAMEIELELPRQLHVNPCASIAVTSVAIGCTLTRRTIGCCSPGRAWF
jgi:hypothetical protein